MQLNNSQDENLISEDSSGLGDAGSNLYNNVTETTKTNQAYLCVGGDKQYHASTEGETSLKQKFKLKTVRPEATAL